MKKYCVFCCLFWVVSAYAQKNTVKTTGNTTTVKLATANDSLQYMLGSFMGQWLNSGGFLITNQALFSKGLNDVLQRQTRLIPDSIVEPLIIAYQKNTKINRALADEQRFFASLRDRQEVGMLPGGVRYIVVKQGKENHPSATDSLLINISARLLDGTVVEDTYKSQKPFGATTSSFFPALNDALKMMTEGSRWQMFVPSALAYGEKGTATIPPYSALIMEVELVEIRSIKK